MGIMAQSHADGSHGGADAIIFIVILFWVFGGFTYVGTHYRGAKKSWRKWTAARRDHKLAMRRVELEIAQAKAERISPPAASATAPGLCRHRKAVPVRTTEGDVVAWLCTSCDTKLPREFSIYEEDL